MRVQLKASLDSSSLQVMNFLNEVVTRYPHAISFAPGRPWEDFFRVERCVAGIGRFIARQAAAEAIDPTVLFNRIGQYGKTNGVVLDAVARHVRRDHGIEVPDEAVMVTSGCQEAMLVVLLGLFDPSTDVLLTSDPTYIGITGLATMLGIEVVPISTGPDGLEVEPVARAVAAVTRRGKRARALYDIPDFNNPLGTRMPMATRTRLLELAHRHDMLIIEDNPYGMFAYDDEPYPPLKALDEQGVVIYLGSFAKTVFPGLRLGYLIAEQPVAGDDATPLAAALSQVKSLTTVNTSPLLQIALAELLDEHGGSLRPLVAEKLPFYRANRDCMLAALERHVARRFASVGASVQWNRPGGGFFMTVDVPFELDAGGVAACARDHGVIVCPMSFFSLTGARKRQIRLSFSYVTPAQIDEGIARLAAFLSEQL